MKAKTLCLLAGTTVPLILTGSVQAGFTGISAVSKPNEFGIFCVNVYAEFDRPGEDFMIGVAGTANAPMLIEVIGGTFYNHAFGGNRAPVGALVAAFPSLAYDTFVTIGVKCIGEPPCQPNEDIQFGGNWPGFGPSSLWFDDNFWAVLIGTPQGEPFNTEYGHNGQVLIPFATSDTATRFATVSLDRLLDRLVS